VIFLFIRPRSGYEIALLMALVAATVVVIVSGAPLAAIGAALCFIALLGPRLGPVRFAKALVSLGLLAWIATVVLGLRVGFLVALGLGTIILSAAEYSGRATNKDPNESPDQLD
jgi:hypothetical protein